MSFIEPLVFLLIIVFLEMMEIAIFNVPKGVLLEKEKSFKNKNNMYSKMVYIKNHTKEAMVIILILDNIIHYLLSFYITKNIYLMNFSYFMENVVTIGFSFIIIYITILVKIFGIMHSQNAIKYFGLPFYYIFMVFRPIGVFFSSISFSFVKNKNEKDNQIESCRNEILASFDDYGYNKEIKEEIGMAKNILLLRDVNLDQIMTHRSDFILLEYIEDIEIMKANLLSCSQRRNIIIWKDNEDNIMGTINVQKFLVDYFQDKIEDIDDYLDIPQFFVYTTDAYRILQYMKNTGHKIVFVIDEDGSISGIVTLDDIFKEIVGETEEEDVLIKKTTEGYIVEGNYNIRMLNRKLNLTLSEESSTIGGLIMMEAKKIPEINESFIINDIEFIVKDRSKNKIKLILIKIKNNHIK